MQLFGEFCEIICWPPPHIQGLWSISIKTLKSDSAEGNPASIYDYNNQFTYNSVGDTELTDTMLWSLAKEITNSTDVRTLGLKLQLDSSQIATSLTNHPNNINDAAFDVLRKWRDSHEDATEAYKEICKALKDAKQNFLISKVLQ